MTVEVTTNLESEISPRQMDFLARLASRVIRYTLRREGVDLATIQVSVLFTCDDFIASLNKRYRDEEGPTDVLAFAMDDGEDSQDLEPGESPMPHMLGDIVISLDTAARQADAHGRPLRQEIALLLVHGTLHLLGYDHDDPQKEAIMWAKQDAILKALNI
ncbi:MAG: rRNA maturation RNase YbeY [Bacillota bacterium]|jgi:probable rRNA maturation factor|nr:rRNA maturation RNase YbeY [Candidatus Fermentithermobacillaceae bacterium]